MSYQIIWPKWIIIKINYANCCGDKQVGFNILPYIILLTVSVVGNILSHTSCTSLSTEKSSFKQNVFYTIALVQK